MNIIQRTKTVLAAIMLAVIPLVITGLGATPASATVSATAVAPVPLIGGGCSGDNDNDNGWFISACISEAPGSILRPDYYINKKAAGYPSNCTIDAFLIDDTSGAVTFVNEVNCSTSLGHHGPWSQGLIRRHRYLTEVVVYYNGDPFASFVSPVAIPGV
jgi:hypothetical protein